MHQQHQLVLVASYAGQPMPEAIFEIQRVLQD
jgi:hypothetical protein